MIDENISLGGDLSSWVMTKCQDWRDHYENNYSEKHEEYYRLWRGIWSKEDTLRDSERSRLIAPALQQAVESSVAEVEEATFGRGNWFDIRDDFKDQNQVDVQQLKAQLMEDFGYCKVRKAVAECILNGAIYGTGVGELVIEEIKEMKPATQPIMEGAMNAVGVEIGERLVVKLNPILPQNFLVDPVATSIEDALGCAVDHYVSTHQVQMDIESGIYRDVDLDTAYSEESLEADQELAHQPEDKVRLTKYYGLVPRELFEEALLDEDEEMAELSESDDSYYVEAIVVIANGGQLLKVEENPYMMQDRPVVTFPWDVVPSRFWGRGICEKGYNSQKALDTELRARIDALALTIHPMMAVDASRLPRGMKPEIKAGKIFLTNGNPAEVLQPFNFGQVGQVTFAQAGQLEQMVQQSTGAVDSTGVAGGVNGEATAAGISMSLGAIIKRHKRTLINFQELFLIPMIQKMAWRYMQYNPDLYPAQDFKFLPASSLGIIAREYEVSQLVQLLQTIPADSPTHSMLVESIIENMNLSKREEMIKRLRESQQPNPEQQQMAQMQQQLEQQMAQVQLAKEQATAAALNAQAAEANSRAQKYQVEASLEQYNAETDRIKAASTNIREGDADDREFQKRMQIAELSLKQQAQNAKLGAQQPPMQPEQPPMQPEQPPMQPEQPAKTMSSPLDGIESLKKQNKA
ncbi:portal protein [Paraglaciecola sp.]|uniref:portal protein n=1 Tax=Paraglaciecola sp. TaxID=1920173 RepID=UPI003EF58690